MPPSSPPHSSNRSNSGSGPDSEDLWTNEEQSYWLAFDQISGASMGVQRIKHLYDRFHSLKVAWHASRSELREIKGFTGDIVDSFLSKRDKIDGQDLLDKVKEYDVQAYPLYHPLYPARLREIHDPPVVIYMKGTLSPDDLRHAVAVVGTRKPSSYGQRLAKDIARELSSQGVTVVSGMAVGVDSLAHWGAIEGGGRTVAVLACGPDTCYPSSNRPLYNALLGEKHGAVLSEFFPGTKPESWRFPARNRVISGLAQATVIVEGSETSGSLITARLAFEQNREVFAIPGRIDSPMSKGTNSLIAKNMAHLMTGVHDIMREMNWVPAPSNREVPTVVQLYGRERQVYEQISNEPVHFDFLCERTGISAAELSATLTMLELAGVVNRQTGDWYTRESSASNLIG